jgi:hypothetical protein
MNEISQKILLILSTLTFKTLIKSFILSLKILNQNNIFENLNLTKKL